MSGETRRACHGHWEERMNNQEETVEIDLLEILYLLGMDMEHTGGMWRSGWWQGS